MSDPNPRALLKHLWWLTLLRGIAAIALGITALLWSGTITVLFMTFGVFAIADGIIALATGIFLRDTNWAWTTLEGIFGLVIGILVLRFPGQTVAVVVVFLALWALVIGLFQVAIAVQLQRSGQKNWGWMLTSGIITTLVGLTFIVDPQIGANFMNLLVGIFAIIAGAVLLFGAFRLRKTVKEILVLTQE